MSIWTEDLFTKKYFWAAAGLIGIIGLGLYFNYYNSIEGQCRRQVSKSTSFFQSNNKLQDLQLKTVTEQLVQECIEKHQADEINI